MLAVLAPFWDLWLFAHRFRCYSDSRQLHRAHVVTSGVGVLVALPAFLAASTGLNGIAELATAMALRKELTGEWPLPLAGVLSLVPAVVLAMDRGVGAPTLARLIGP